MIVIKFNKKRAEYLLRSLAEGTPIHPPDTSGWTGDDMLALAGACFFGAMSQGPGAFGPQDTPAEGEYREAQAEQFMNDLHAAIECYGHWSMLVQDDKYDSEYEQEVMAAVTQNGEVRKTLAPIAGIKKFNGGAKGDGLAL